MLASNSTSGLGSPPSSHRHTLLAAVSRYEIGNYVIARPVMGQFAAFNLIVKRFIAEGSRDEINIGYGHYV